jgi:cyclic pyranopterin phosphate synthase
MDDDGIVAMARHFRHTGHIVRFIEFMDVGSTNAWRMDDVVPSREVLERIRPLELNLCDGRGENILI